MQGGQERPLLVAQQCACTPMLSENLKNGNAYIEWGPLVLLQACFLEQKGFSESDVVSAGELRRRTGGLAAGLHPDAVKMTLRVPMSVQGGGPCPSCWSALCNCPCTEQRHCLHRAAGRPHLWPSGVTTSSVTALVLRDYVAFAGWQKESPLRTSAGLHTDSVQRLRG